MSEHIGPVHGGAALGLIKQAIECNAYCRPPVHCDVNYSKAGVTQEQAEAIAARDNRLMSPSRIVRVERAYEAPKPDPDLYFFTEGVDPEQVIAWLVFWEATE